MLQKKITNSKKNIFEFENIRAKLEGISFTFPAIGNYGQVTLLPEKKLVEKNFVSLAVPFPYTIYGTIMDVGGEKPNIHLRPSGKESDIICDCSEELASEAAKLLYMETGIIGDVIQCIPTIRMKAHTISPYRRPTKNPFEILKEAGISEYFENETVEEFMKRMHDEDYENA